MVQLRRYDITFFDRDLGSYTLHWVAANLILMPLQSSSLNALAEIYTFLKSIM